MKNCVISSIVALSMLLSVANAEKHHGITFSGGGFRAHAVASGVMAGFLEAASKKTGNPELGFEELLSNFDAVASNSGGSWFTAQMIYSQNFVQLLEDVAHVGANASQAADVYAAGWVDKFLNVSHVPRVLSVGASKELEAIEDLLKFIDGTLVPWATLIVHFFFEQKVSWDTFVNAILSSQGDLDATSSLSHAPVNEWARGKVYALAAALVTPEDNHATFGAYDQACVESTGATQRSVVYQYSAGLEPGQSMPISFSTELGSNANSEAPYPFMRLPNAIEFSVTYAKQSRSTIASFGKIISETQTSLNDTPGPGMHSNQVPIKDAVSSSSAFLSQSFSQYEHTGKTGLMLNAMGLWDDALAFVMSASMHPSVEPSKMFDSAYSSIQPHPTQSCDQLVQDVQDQFIMSVSDGANVDNSAVSFLVSDAKDGDSFTLVLNTNHPGEYYDLKQLFTGGSSPFATVIPLFAQDQRYVNETLQSFEKLEIPSGLQLINSISYGSIVGTTLDVPFYGITAGKSITLNVISVGSDMGLAPKDWYDISRLVGEITSSIVDSRNTERVATLLETFF